MTLSLRGKPESLTCPDCGTVFPGAESAVCTNGHKEILLDWWETCTCGHDSHYDMTTFCLADDCDCEAWAPNSDDKRQVVRRLI